MHTYITAITSELSAIYSIMMATNDCELDYALADYLYAELSQELERIHVCFAPTFDTSAISTLI